MVVKKYIEKFKTKHGNISKSNQWIYYAILIEYIVHRNHFLFFFKTEQKMQNKQKPSSVHCCCIKDTKMQIKTKKHKYTT